MPKPSASSKQLAVWWTIIIGVALLTLALLMMPSSNTEEHAEQSKADELFLKAVKFEKQGDTVGAVENYRAALQHDPSHPDACYRLALINVANKHFERAELLLNRALKRDPDNYLINYHLGLTFDRVAEPDSATFYLKRAIELEPEFARGHYSLGLLWINRQEPDSAIAYLNNYLNLMPADTQNVREVKQLIEGLESVQ